ncbi:probable ribose-5-phosphate isomerase 4, chloroplastic isoform X1 [Oryza glaberrima]|uniref:ribose-5-phosphate isomerase n=1 Tax=Oryza glaberrima TaxID=4538 RepID=I1PG32_ORYGL|nr:probable ribose-5-phosphate isomerase 4, chloroplastic isoform X1 [Oryza glaberrima]
MDAVAGASVSSSSARLRPCPRPRRIGNVAPATVRRRTRRRAVTCAAAADADVVGLFDAAKLTVDRFVESGMVVGLGSGPASGLAIQYLGTRLRRGSLTGILGIPSSTISASEAEKAGIQVSSYEEGTQIDFAFTDADIIEEDTMTAVIGRRKTESGEPSFMVEKGIVKSADKLAFIIGHEKYVKGIEGSIPVLVKSANWIDTAEEIDDLFLGDAEVWRRPSIGTAGPLGGDFPLVTKEGHHVLDVIFTTPIPDLGKVAESLEKIAGVVDHGIVSSIPSYVVVALNGEVQVLDEKSSVIP